MKKVTLISMMLMLLIMCNVSAFASTDDIIVDGPDGDMTIEEGANLYPEDYEETRILEQEKLNALGGLRALYYAVIAVPVFEQERIYWCAPATVKQVQHYVTGGSYLQSTIARDLKTTEDGTDMTVIPKWINAYVNNSHYVYSSIGTKSEWYDKVKSSVNDKYPAILDINTTNVSEIPYDSKGHFVNASGFDLNSLQVRITDPWGPGLGNKWYSIEGLYKANNDHFRKAIIW